MALFRGLAPRFALSSWVLLGCLAQPCWVWSQEAGVHCLERDGVLLARSGKSWQTLKPGDQVAPGTSLVVLFGADLESANKAVGIRLLGDIGEFGPLPVLDTAVRVLDNGKADAALALERGLVVLTNNKKDGAATVVLTLRGEEVSIILKTPGTKLGLELYGRHPGGLPHILKDDPTTFLYVLVGNGSATISAKSQSFALSAPPGPAMFRWDSATKQPEVVNLEKFPAELIRDDKAKAQFAKLCVAAEKLGGKVRASAAAMVKSEDALERRVAVTALGAVDDLPHLLDALEDAKHKDVREQAVLVLRSWMGRSSGQLKGLRIAMLKHKYSLPQMKTTMHLLFGFDEQERQRPVVFELLIQSLDHKSVSVRELAHWHLVRLAPAGRDIAYDAGAPEAERQAALERWRQLIPPGELPPRPKKDK